MPGLTCGWYYCFVILALLDWRHVLVSLALGRGRYHNCYNLRYRRYRLAKISVSRNNWTGQATAISHTLTQRRGYHIVSPHGTARLVPNKADDLDFQRRWPRIMQCLGYACRREVPLSIGSRPGRKRYCLLMADRRERQADVRNENGRALFYLTIPPLCNNGFGADSTACICAF